MVNVLVIGSNPSNSSPDVSPFHMSTRSRLILDRWFKDIRGLNKAYINVADIKKENNKPLTRKEIAACIPSLQEKLKNYHGYKVVAIGKAAAYACSKLPIKYLELPHPSGLNRQLNDPAFVQEKIKTLVEFVNEG